MKAKYRIVQASGQYYPERFDWLFGWRDLREVDGRGYRAICHSSTEALDVIKLAATPRPNVIWEKWL